MIIRENSLESQRERHDIPPGWYAVLSVRARASRDGRSVASFAVRLAGTYGMNDRVYPDTAPVAVVQHDPLIDAIWDMLNDPDHVDTGESRLDARPVWMVELGPAGKPLGFTRATEVYNLGGWSSHCHIEARERSAERAWQHEKRALTREWWQ